MGAYNYISTIHPAAKGLIRTLCRFFKLRQCFEFRRASMSGQSLKTCKASTFCRSLKPSFEPYKSFRFCKSFEVFSRCTGSFSPAFPAAFLSTPGLLPQASEESSAEYGYGVSLESHDSCSAECAEGSFESAGNCSAGSTNGVSLCGDDHQHRRADQQHRREDQQDRCEVLRSYGLDSTGECAVLCGASADFFCEECGWVCELCARGCARSDHQLREPRSDLQNSNQAEIGAESRRAVASQTGAESETVLGLRIGVASFIRVPSESRMGSGLSGPEVRDEAGMGGLR